MRFGLERYIDRKAVVSMTHDKGQTQLHFVGIGGIGMSGIAEVFLNQGYQVTGSDLQDTDTTRRLRALGAKIFIGHGENNVSGAHVVIISSAVKTNNPEVIAAKRARVPVIPRAEMLGELMRGKLGIAVAGTHGKTSTTSMLATILTHAGLDPTLVIGGKVDSLGGNAKLGQGEYVVAEADESDGSFLQLPATYGVITNIDNDHLDHYGSLTAVDDAFVQFVAKLPFYGLAAVCGEDPGVQRVLSRFTKPVVTYGFSEAFDYWAEQIEVHGMSSSFVVRDRGEALGSVELRVPGRHNVMNALAAIILALRLGVPFDRVAEGLKTYSGVKRRFDLRWRDEAKRQIIVDDYGHHPTEIAATLAAARSYWNGRIITVFQPHRYSRTLHCQTEFTHAFQDTDILLLTDIYSAGEDPIPGVTGEFLAKQIARATSSSRKVEYVGSLENASKRVHELLAEGDLVICLGAGSITRLPDQLIEGLASTRPGE